jgi:uridine kinase
MQKRTFVGVAFLATFCLSQPLFSAERIFIGIAGGSASGKTTLAARLLNVLKKTDPLLYEFEPSEVGLVSQDNYYLPELQPKSDYVPYPGQPDGIINYDNPSAMDFKLMRQHFIELEAGKSIETPVYDFVTGQRTEKTVKSGPYQIVIFEGIHALHDPEIRDLLDLKVFVDLDDQVRFERRLIRDQKERGKTPEDIILWYNLFVKPSYDTFIAKTRKFADLVVKGDSQTSQYQITRKIFSLIDQKISIRVKANP